MRWKPRLIPTVVAAFVAVTCARLGGWQLQRYGESQATSEAILSAWNQPPLQGLDPSAGPELAHRQARVEGAWVPGREVVVRATPVAGEPGYQLIATLALSTGGRLLVDRGWVPMAVTAAELATLDEPGTVVVEGLVVPITGDRSLRAVPGPDGLTRWPLEMDLLWGVLPRAVGLPFASLADAAPEPVVGVALRRGPALEHEDERRMGPLPVGGYVLPIPQTHHLSYAFQWFAFATLAVLIWAWFSRAPSESSHE